MTPARLIPAAALVALVALFAAATAGCAVKVDGQNKVDVGPYDFTRYGKSEFDASRVPPTKSHEEARQKLTEAYAEIHRLNDIVRNMEKDNEKLDRKLSKAEDELDEARDELEELKERRRPG